MNSTLKIAALLLTAALTLTACGSEDETGTASGGNHNDADVAFATDMIQHHAQALSMVDLTMGRDLDPEIETLAEDIRAAQAPEIETMTDWLQQWDEPVPETVRDHAHAGGDGHGGTDMEDDMNMPGMMSAEDMTALENAQGAAFEEMWLEMMIEHHQGAIEMALTEQEEGEHPPAIELAEEVETSQQSEVEAMQEILGS